MSLAKVFDLQNTSELLVVISHDCDIVEADLEFEPSIEVIVGELVDEADPNRTHAKSPNMLHLEILFEGQPRFLELRAPRKHSIPKADLVSIEPDDRFALDDKARRILQSWLAARYQRSAFPDALNGHLSAIRNTLHDLGKRSPDAIVGFYMYHEPDEELGDPKEPYELWITVVFDHTMPGAEQIAGDAAKKIAARLHKKFETATGWRFIDLRSCKCRSDIDFSLYDAQTMRLYRLDHISLKHSAD
jgi:hypothetical protein